MAWETRKRASSAREGLLRIRVLTADTLSVYLNSFKRASLCAWRQFLFSHVPRMTANFRRSRGASSASMRADRTFI